MSQQINCQNPICAQLGIKSILVNKGLKLQERFQISNEGPSNARKQRVDPKVELEEARSQISDLEIQETTQNMKDLYHLGQDCTLDNVSEIADVLLKRDLEEVYNLNLTNPKLEGLICIPKEFIPRIPTVSVLDKDKMVKSVNSDSLSTDEVKKKSYINAFHNAEGDFVEKNAYNVTKEVFSKSEHNVVMIQGIELKRINPDRNAEARELDLLVIDQDLGMIINIECQKKFANVFL